MDQFVLSATKHSRTKLLLQLKKKLCRRWGKYFRKNILTTCVDKSNCHCVKAAFSGEIFLLEESAFLFTFIVYCALLVFMKGQILFSQRGVLTSRQKNIYKGRAPQWLVARAQKLQVSGLSPAASHCRDEPSAVIARLITKYQ